MLKVFFVVGITLIVSTSFGILLARLLKLQDKGFTAPLGFAALLFTLQLFYYPIQLFNLSSIYIHIISSIVFAGLIMYAIFEFKSILKQFWNRRTLWIFASVLAFIFVFYHVSISIPRADGQMYLNYIAQNIDNNELNNFNLWTGLVGEEFVTIYLFQGYYHFAGFLVKFVNVFSSTFNIGSKIDTLVVSLWGLGTIYAFVSSMFIINVINYFKYKNHWIPRILAVFTLFFTNFYYWKVSFSFYGNTWRSLFMAMFMFYLYRMIKENNRKYIIYAGIIFGASIAASSSSLFIGFSILLGVAFYFFKSNSKTAFEDASYIGLPMVLYVLAIVYKDSFSAFIILLLITIVYYGLHNLKLVRPYFKLFNEFISKHAILIFVIILPIIAIVYSFIDMTIHPEYPWNLYHYFNDHAAYDMVKNYLFLYSDWVDISLNLLRWISIIVLIFKYRNDKSNNYLLHHFLLLAVFFLNPLTTSFISRMFASNVYYRAYESLFNVFTETFLFGLLLNTFWDKKLVKLSLVSILLVAVVYSHYSSYVLQDKASLYGYYINDGKNVLPLYKIKNSELDLIRALERESENFVETNRQITVVSHVDGLRTFLPSLYQVFTARQYWSAWDRIDQDFYQVARMWYGWEEKPKDINYTKTCFYLKKYKIDYVLNEIWQNSEFDSALNECTDVLYENYEYRLRKVVNK